MDKIALIVLLLLVSCSEESKPKQESSDGCMAYVIKPGGKKECMSVVKP